MPPTPLHRHASHASTVDAHPTCWRDAVAALNALVDSPHLVDVVRSGSAIIIHPAGPSLAERDVPRILEAATTAIGALGQHLQFIVLDLSDVRAISAYGLGLCSELAKRAAGAGFEPILVGASRQVLDGLRMFRTDRLYRVVRSRGDLAQLVGEHESRGDATR